jgi:hypothetical protein
VVLLPEQRQVLLLVHLHNRNCSSRSQAKTEKTTEVIYVIVSPFTVYHDGWLSIAVCGETVHKQKLMLLTINLIKLQQHRYRRLNV